MKRVLIPFAGSALETILVPSLEYQPMDSGDAPRSLIEEQLVETCTTSVACAAVRITHLQLVGDIVNGVAIVTNKMMLDPTQRQHYHDGAAIVLQDALPARIGWGEVILADPCKGKATICQDTQYFRPYNKVARTL